MSNMYFEIFLPLILLDSIWTSWLTPPSTSLFRMQTNGRFLNGHRGQQFVAIQQPVTNTIQVGQCLLSYWLKLIDILFKVLLINLVVCQDHWHITQSQCGKIQTGAQKGEGLDPLLTLTNTLVGNLVVTKFSQPRPFVTICLSDKSLH